MKIHLDGKILSPVIFGLGHLVVISFSQTKKMILFAEHKQCRGISELWVSIKCNNNRLVNTTLNIMQWDEQQP